MSGRVHEALAAARLVDHHCHGVVVDGLDRTGFESLLTEGAAWPGISSFDSPVGVAVRRHCAPCWTSRATRRPTPTWPAARNSALRRSTVAS